MADLHCEGKLGVAADSAESAERVTSARASCKDARARRTDAGVCEMATEFGRAARTSGVCSRPRPERNDFQLLANAAVKPMSPKVRKEKIAQM